MIDRPALKPHFVAVPADGGSVLLLSERKRVLLRGRLVARLAPLLDGTLTADEIVARLADAAPAAEVREALASLERKGYLVDAGGGTGPEAAYWSIQDVDPSAARDRLRAAAVSVERCGDVDVAPLLEALDASGVRVDGGAGLALVLADDYLRADLAAVNRRMLAGTSPWLLAKPVGAELWIGPLFRPGVTACWACLEPRVRGNREVESFAASVSGGEPVALARAASPASVRVAAHLVAAEAARWIASGSVPALEGAVVSFDMLSLASASHRVVRRPQCPACGAADRSSLSRAGLPVALASRAAARSDGGQRAVAPEVTVERYRHLVSPITGWVSRLERAAADDGGIAHVYFAGHNFARHPARSVASLKTSLRSHSSGKGASDAQARASGLCEALERASGLFDGDEPRVAARLADLAGAAVHPHALLNYSERQYAARDPRDGRHALHGRVPAPFDEGREIEWTPAWSLTRVERRYLPTAFCYYGYTLPEDHRFCAACSNGCAAGNTLEEAILQGFFELVERDAVAIWWYNRVPRPALDMEGLADPYFARHAGHLRSRGRELWLLDLTSDLGVPVVGAVSRRAEGPEEILLGFGAHADPEVAALRAVTELNQMLAWTGDGAPGAAPGPLSDVPTVRWLRTATVAGNPYLAPSGPLRRPADVPQAWPDDLREGVLRCNALVEKHGLEMIVLDQTRPDIGLPVVKVVVPGLRHFWARFGPGRLYDVPVRLGWLGRPLGEDELNPVEMIL